MKQSTSISTEDIEISTRDASITALSFRDNKKIYFLPIRVHEAFPNLWRYSASDCALTTISRKNFNNLNKLRQLLLHFNQIKTIHSDTFIDLISLEMLDLGKKNIFFYKLLIVIFDQAITKSKTSTGEHLLG
jgi:hypothetical protein